MPSPAGWPPGRTLLPKQRPDVFVQYQTRPPARVGFGWLHRQLQWEPDETYEFEPSSATTSNWTGPSQTTVTITMNFSAAANVTVDKAGLQASPEDQGAGMTHPRAARSPPSMPPSVTCTAESAATPAVDERRRRVVVRDPQDSQHRPEDLLQVDRIVRGHTVEQGGTWVGAAGGTRACRGRAHRPGASPPPPRPGRGNPAPCPSGGW